jgi:all-trans-retinol 13,14-reductase
MARQYDIVIIGSGLGGLITAALLGKEGYSVCVVEKNNVFGGSLQTFKRNGVEFDTGMHYFGSMDKGQFMYKLFKYLGIYDKLKIKRLDIDGFDIFNYMGKEYVFAQGFDNFIEKLSVDFPSEKKSIVEFINKIKEIGQSENMFNLISSKNGDHFRISPYYSQNAFREISSITSDLKLQNILSGLNELIGGGKEKTNMFIFGMTYHSYIESAWRFVGGASQLTNALIAKIEQAGGTLIKNTEVTAIELDDNKRASAVLTNKNNVITGKYFISDIHPTNTIKLLPKKSLRKVYKNRISRITNSPGMFSLYLVLKEDSFKYLNYNYFEFLSESTWTNTETQLGSWPQRYWFATQAPENNSDFARGIIVLSPIDHTVFNKWTNTGVEKRGQDYKNLKTGLAEKLLEKVFKRFPELKQAIKTYYTATPLTYRDYLGSPNGTAYGMVKDSDRMFETFVLPKTQIKNLLLTGQNINGHGMLGVSTGSLFTISYITDIRKIIEKISYVE